MRPIHFVSAGIAALFATSTAMAGTCVINAPANDCDDDGFDDVVDLCPFDATPGDNSQTTELYDDGSGPLPTGAACTGSDVEVHPSAVIGHGVALRDGTRLFSQADIGDYAQIGGGTEGNATVGVKATLIDAPSPAFGTVFPSGVIGRLAVSGEDPSTVPQAAREGDVVSGEDFTTGRNAQIGFGVRMGEGVTLGYAAIVGPQAVLGDRVTIGQLAEVGWGATIGDDFTLARSSSVGNFANIGDNVTVGPDVTIGTYASIGATDGTAVRIRKGVTIGKWTTIEQGSRIGRNTSVGDYGEVLGVTLRANTQVLPGGIACDDSDPPAGVTTCAAGGYYARNAIIDGNAENVPAEPSGTFFSAAGGVVCTNPNTDINAGPLGCNRIANEVNGVTRYCLDNDFDTNCDGGTPGVPAQAIVITAPDTIGVSPYCYNDNGSTVCETLQSEPGTCGGAGQPPCYQLQAGPIYVLSPPDAN